MYAMLPGRGLPQAVFELTMPAGRISPQADVPSARDPPPRQSRS
jgi:hypothetical protein